MALAAGLRAVERAGLRAGVVLRVVADGRPLGVLLVAISFKAPLA